MRRFALILSFLVVGAPIAAQQRLDPTAMSLEDLMATPVDHVYGASKFLQKVTDAPASVTIITAEEIKLYGHRTLADVLRSVEGISMSYDRNYSYLGLRGLSRPGDYNSRVLVLIDGHRMNDNIEDQANLGTDFQLDVNLIDRVEVIRGPSAALYGSSAFSAVIAVISKQGHHVDGLEASASTASYNANYGRVTWGKRYSTGLELLVSGSVLRTDGPAALFFPEFNTTATNGGYASGADGDRARNVAVTASWSNFTVHGIYSARAKDVPTASFDTVFNSAREKTFDGRDWLDLQYTKEIGRSVDVLARVYWDRYAYDGYYPYPAGVEEDPERLVINRDQYQGAWWGGEVAFSGRVGHAHRLTAGTEYRQNVQQRQQNYDEDPRIVYIDSHPHTYAVALNLQDEYTLSRHVLVSLAGRAERIATGATGFTPKLGVIMTPRINTTVKLLFSRALRAPSAYELYYDSPSNAGNPGLKPERMESTELNVEHFLTSSMKIEGSLFRSTYRDLIVGVANGSTDVILQNGLDARADGLELSWTMKHRAGLEARASYSTLFDTDQASNAWTSGAPKHLAKVNIGRPVKPLRLTLGWELQYESERHAHNGDALEPAVVANLNVVRSDLLKGLDLKASIFNLFGEHYSEPVSENHLQGGITQDGRQFFLSLTWEVQLSEVTLLRRAASIILAVVLLASFPGVSAGQLAPAREYEIKAGFLFNFAKFVDWPDDAFTGESDAFRLEVIGHDPFDGALDRLVAGKTIRNHRVVIVYSPGISPGAPAQMVFVSASEQQQLPKILTALKSGPTLTVSDIDRFADRGGVIGLVVEGQSVRFVINRTAASQARLRVSSTLLSLARIIGRDSGFFSAGEAGRVSTGF